MRIGILTGGGDTQALNAILYGAATGAEKYNHLIVGFKKGWEGVLNPLGTIELERSSINASIGGTLLKSSRKNLEDTILKEAALSIQKRVDCLVAVGGDDTLSVGVRVMRYLDIPIVFVTKTIDNDVGKNAPCQNIDAWPIHIDYAKIVNYFNPGFPTAAGIIQKFASDLRTTAYSHERVIFLESMGRTPGWLALSSFAAEPAPDFIIVPECPVDYADLKEKIAERYQEKKNVLVVVAEGAKYKGSSKPISQDESDKDTFGHPKLGGVAEILAERIKHDLCIENCNGVKPGLLYRCGPPCQLDRNIGMSLGEKAVKAAIDSMSEYVAVVQRTKDYLSLDLRPLSEVVTTNALGIIEPRALDLRFYDPINYCITDTGREYFKALGIGDKPKN